jgi:hypothetical protein
VRGITNARRRIMPSKIKKLEREVGKLPVIPKELVNQS